MPVYEYHCTKCDHDFEVIQKFSDPPKKKCPECSGKVEKKISQSAFHLKGSGWYVTDYANKDKEKKEKKKVSSTSSTEKAPEKPASTPAASSETKSS